MPNAETPVHNSITDVTAEHQGWPALPGGPTQSVSAHTRFLGQSGGNQAYAWVICDIMIWIDLAPPSCKLYFWLDLWFARSWLTQLLS